MLKRLVSGSRPNHHLRFEHTGAELLKGHGAGRKGVLLERLLRASSGLPSITKKGSASRATIYIVIQLNSERATSNVGLRCTCG